MASTSRQKKAPLISGALTSFTSMESCTVNAYAPAVVLLNDLASPEFFNRRPERVGGILGFSIAFSKPGSAVVLYAVLLTGHSILWSKLPVRHFRRF